MLHHICLANESVYTPRGVFCYHIVMTHEVPFIQNTEDDLHCLQAAYMMIVKYYRPDFKVDWNEWSKVTGFEIGKGTWASAGVLWFSNNGFEVKHYEIFDYDMFFETGGEYLIQKNGKEVGQWQIEHSNIQAEQNRAKQMIDKGLLENIEPTIKDIKTYLDEGYLLRASLNSRRLNGKEGYFGHAVTVIGYDDGSFTVHDPGLPPYPNRRILFDDFEAAWADPNNEAKELDAIKLKN